MLGLGQMGRAVALRLAGNGYPVTGWSAHPATITGVRTLAGPAALAQAAADAQVLVNLLPLTPATRGLIDARLLAALPRGASVVNLARGAHASSRPICSPPLPAASFARRCSTCSRPNRCRRRTRSGRTRR